MKPQSTHDNHPVSDDPITSPARRQFMNLLGVGTAAAAMGALSLAAPHLAEAAPRSRIRVVAFDCLAVFDTRPILALTEHLFPHHGAALSKAWHGRQFEYTWLRTITGTYVDFWQVTDEALGFAAEMLKVPLPREKRTRLMQSFLALKTWPDVIPALKKLKAHGVSLALLANFTDAMMHAGVKNSGLEGVFDSYLSTDRVQAYKPDPRAYQMALDEFRLTRDEVAFVAFAGWDAAGAKTFGYPTYWADRLGLPAEALGVSADATRRTFADLPAFVRNHAAARSQT